MRRSWLILATLPMLGAGPLRFERVVIDPNLPDAYQVEVADVDGDKRPDIVALGNRTLAWYQNPTWRKRVIVDGTLAADLISSATRDLDGDGRAEIALAYDFAMNQPTRGKLALLIPGRTIDDPWTPRPVGAVPSIHRVRWADLDGDARPELVVASLFGPKVKPPAYDADPATLQAFTLGEDPTAADRWTSHALAHRPILHAFAVGSGRVVAGPRNEVWTADANGTVSITWAGPKHRATIRDEVPGGPHGLAGSLLGHASSKPTDPASEIHIGRSGRDARNRDGWPFLVTISPWHGSRVVVRSYKVSTIDLPAYTTPEAIDDTLDDGHALWVADVDGDGTDEVFAGHRGKDHRVAVYRRVEPTRWERTVIDTAIAAQDLRGGDLDGDGVPDVVAVGGRTHNVVWYRPIRTP